MFPFYICSFFFFSINTILYIFLIILISLTYLLTLHISPFYNVFFLYTSVILVNFLLISSHNYYVCPPLLYISILSISFLYNISSLCIYFSLYMFPLLFLYNSHPYNFSTMYDSLLYMFLLYLSFLHSMSFLCNLSSLFSIFFLYILLHSFFFLNIVPVPYNAFFFYIFF